MEDPDIREALRSLQGSLRGEQSEVPLYDWQKEALQAWNANGRHGVVEAVTGAGKTRLGLAAAKERSIEEGGWWSLSQLLISYDSGSEN